MNELIVLLDGREVGIVNQKSGRLTFTYSRSWFSAAGAYPLSLSMPLASQTHPHAAIASFIWGLLPDNETVLRQWAQRFQVSPRNPFSLIANVGEDCAGAVQFVLPERLEALRAGVSNDVQWLRDDDVAARLRALKSDAGAGRMAQDTGQFSLAGAQPKTALLLEGLRWGVPTGRMPTTHILKPASAEFDGHAENEHLCLALARALGLPVANSQVWMFEEITAIVVARYDRVRTAGLAAEAAARAANLVAQITTNPNANPSAIVDLAAAVTNAVVHARVMEKFSKTTLIYRVHQEDMCQALRIDPRLKYQNEGGPGPKQIVELLGNYSSEGGAQKGRGVYETNTSARAEDIETFIKALIFNWLIGGTDAHGKNYSVMIGGNGLVRLAPLYDIASILCYPQINPQSAKLAMKIGSEYCLRDIGFSQWRALAADVGFEQDRIISLVKVMAMAMPDTLGLQIELAKKSGLSHHVFEKLRKSLVDRSMKIVKL